jgi:small subunit ribosomal protein S16
MAHGKCPERLRETRGGFLRAARSRLFVCRKALGQARIVSRRTGLVLMIRLSRIGKKKKPFYRVVVIEKTRPRNGRVVELVGTYDPLKKPAELKLDAERIKHWLGVGAQPSDTVRSFIRLQKIA